LYNGELHNLYSTPNVIRMIKPRRMRLVEHVTRTREGEEECVQEFGGKARKKEANSRKT
jgi:hypothetical protein